MVLWIHLGVFHKSNNRSTSSTFDCFLVAMLSLQPYLSCFAHALSLCCRDWLHSNQSRMNWLLRRWEIDLVNHSKLADWLRFSLDPRCPSRTISLRISPISPDSRVHPLFLREMDYLSSFVVGWASGCWCSLASASILRCMLHETASAFFPPSTEIPSVHRLPPTARDRRYFPKAVTVSGFSCANISTKSKTQSLDPIVFGVRPLGSRARLGSRFPHCAFNISRLLCFQDPTHMPHELAQRPNLLSTSWQVRFSECQIEGWGEEVCLSFIELSMRIYKQKKAVRVGGMMYKKDYNLWINSRDCET